MDHNGYFGLCAAHIFPLDDEENLVYGEGVDVGELGGIINIALDAQTSSDTTYATDRPWIDSETDNGFSGTMQLVNVWGHPVLRRLFAAICGYDMAADGTLLGSSNRPRKKFALMGEASGNLENKRTCYLSCQAGKPSKNAQTRQESGNHQPDEFSIISRPVRLPSGWMGSFYENVPEDGTAYTGFYDRVRTDLEPATGGEAALAALTLGTSALTPAFATGTLTYALATTEGSLPVTAVPTDPEATVAITNGGATVANGGTAELVEGENTIVVTVTNGTSSKTYTVTVTRS